MKKLILAIAAFTLMTAPAIAAPEIGKPAPDFSATAIDGKEFKLSDNKGKIVVLEWTNPECPFVHKHYDSGNMQQTQKDALARGVVWVSINSAAPERDGHQTADEAKTTLAERNANPTAYILDEKGDIGHLYGASTTPHMFVIDKDGALAYMGAIDDNSSPNPDTIKGAKNYVTTAIDELTAGKPVTTPVSQPYGCAVKYAQ